MAPKRGSKFNKEIYREMFSKNWYKRKSCSGKRCGPSADFSLNPKHFCCYCPLKERNCLENGTPWQLSLLWLPYRKYTLHEIVALDYKLYNTVHKSSEPSFLKKAFVMNI